MTKNSSLRKRVLRGASFCCLIVIVGQSYAPLLEYETMEVGRALSVAPSSLPRGDTRTT